VPVAAQQAPAPAFRSNVSVVVVDVVVRDRSGAIVRGLTAGDFELREDNRPQQIRSFDFEEVTTTAPAATPAPALLTDAAVAPPAATATAKPAAPLRREDLAGRRLVVLLFDLSSMQPDELDRAGQAAVDYVDHQMTASDLVAVATIDTTLDVLTDFTADREAVKQALAHFTAVNGVAFETPAAETAATDEAGGATGGSAEYDVFNNDARLRAIKTLADALAPVEQKKAILYFSSGMARSGSDNQVELRTAISAAVRANVSLYPVDSRGLQAVVPGGDATRASSFGTGAFSGRGVRGQFDQLQASQETLQTLAADTGGKAFTDSNDFSGAFTQVIRDTSAYYLLGYSSTNDVKDGRFRRITVRVKRPDLRVEHRNGYYAERDFAHTTRQDREGILEEQLNAAVSLTDLPLVVGTGWFRQDATRFYVPIAMAVPGSAVPAPPAGNAAKVAFDVRGIVRDEQGRTVGRIRDTLDVPAGENGSLAGRLVLYQSGVTLPPGRFSVKVVVRENAAGTVGSFEAPIAVPQLRDAGIKVSPPVMSTQLQPASRERTANPLVRDGVQLLPNLTRTVGRNQNVYFYFEVYDPALADGAPDVRTSLAFYRGNVKVYETPVVERTMIDDAARKAVLFQLEVPASAFTPGTYTCQVNVIDAVAGKVAFPRLTFQVR